MQLPDRLRPNPVVIVAEDLLKAVAHQGLLDGSWTLADVSPGVETEHIRAALAQLTRSGLIHATGTRHILTPAGRARAVELLRAHRVVETFLSRERGTATSDLHAEADRAEHLLSVERVNALADAMNRPRFDPHGDPIPGRHNDFCSPDHVCLRDWTAGTPALVSHIEDEPPEDFRVLNNHGFAPELPLLVTEQDESQTTVIIAGETITLPARIAAHVHVTILPDDSPDPASIRRLTALRHGETAEIDSLSPACTGPERRRMLDLGIVPGSSVTREFASPMGSPVAYAVRGTLIGLRTAQARNIFIRKKS